MNLKFLLTIILVVCFYSCLKVKEVKSKDSDDSGKILIAYDTLVIYHDEIRKNYMYCNFNDCGYSISLKSSPEWVNSGPTGFTLYDTAAINFAHTFRPGTIRYPITGEMVYYTPFGLRSFIVKAVN